MILLILLKNKGENVSPFIFIIFENVKILTILK